MLNSDTPIDINDVNIDDVIGYVDDKTGGMPSARVRLNYVKMLYDILGLTLTSDIALASISEPRAELVISTAGSGKTTWAQVKAIEQKLVRKSKNGSGKPITGSQILCLVYNNHNVADMKLKHSQMVNRLLAANVKGLDIDTSINACTMHSFCDFFRRQFVAKLDLIGFRIADDAETVSLMKRATVLEFKINKIEITPNIPYDKIHSLYVLTKETLKEVDKCTETDLFLDIGLESGLLQGIFDRYDVMKAKAKKYEFIDMLYRVYRLLATDTVALRSVQEYYEYVIADEVQDFTPLMWEILKLFVSDGTPLTCIGDEDQNLYLFRGADIKYMLDFKTNFPGGKVYSLSENRRCGEVILSEARRVIEDNTLRFDKNIHGTRKGGSVKFLPYNTLEGQAIKLIAALKELSVDELNRTVVCYRNINDSVLITDMLSEAKIPINCLRSSMPYSHELYKHLLDIYLALEMPKDRQVYKNLWKVLPCKKAEFFEAIGYNPEIGKFNTTDDKIHFAEFNYGKLLQYSGFGDAIAVLREASERLSTEFMSNSFPVIMRMLNMYFWSYKKSLNESSEVDAAMEERIKKMFCVQKTFNDVYVNIQNVRRICSNNTQTGCGVTLSTFHSLKGLEFKHVFAIGLDNDNFPNYPLIEYKGYSSEVEKSLKEAETRLWYVAITRAKDSFTAFYNESNPSKYVLDYFESTATRIVIPETICNLDEDDFACESGAEEPTVLMKTLEYDNTPLAQSEMGVTDVDETETLQSSESTGNSAYLASLFAQL